MWLLFLLLWHHVGLFDWSVNSDSGPHTTGFVFVLCEEIYFDRLCNAGLCGYFPTTLFRCSPSFSAWHIIGTSHGADLGSETVCQKFCCWKWQFTPKLEIHLPSGSHGFYSHPRFDAVKSLAFFFVLFFCFFVAWNASRHRAQRNNGFKAF